MYRVTRVLRVRRRMLQTPVIRYRHQKTGRTVTLVGTIHVGEAAYYKRLFAGASSAWDGRAGSDWVGWTS